MADTKTFGVKVPEELHQEATELQKKLGLSGEGFLNELVRAYKLEKAKEDMPQVVEDIKELQALTQRINNIYLNLGYRVENITKAKDLELKGILDKKDSIILALQSKVDQTEDEKTGLAALFNDSVSQRDDAIQRVSELTESNNSYKALIQEYKEKNDTLAGLLNEYKSFKTEVEEYKKLLTDAQGRNAELSNRIKDKEYENSTLTSELENLKLKHKEEIEVLKARQAEELQRAIDKASFDKDKALLEQEKKHQELVNKLNDDSNAKIRELLHENQEYNERVKDLLNQIAEDKRRKTPDKTDIKTKKQ